MPAYQLIDGIKNCSARGAGLDAIAIAAGRRGAAEEPGRTTIRRVEIGPHSTRARCPVDNATGSSTRARRRRSRSREYVVGVTDGTNGKAVGSSLAAERGCNRASSSLFFP
jgi:UDP-N-acetylmuramyl tripeptide synthase